MTRCSCDHFRDGLVYNGYDYDLQCWVVQGIIQRCGHPNACHCFGRKYADQKLTMVRELAEVKLLLAKLNGES
jgi:hypothetical protein